MVETVSSANTFIYVFHSLDHSSTIKHRSCANFILLESYILMRKQCLIFMLLLPASTAVTQELYIDEKIMPHVMLLPATSTAVTQELYLDEKTMAHVYVIASCIYCRLFLYLMNSKSDATYTSTYLMCMLLLAASEHAEKNPLKTKF